ncbi:MAG: tRNA (adenosine(37)-N6)-dimethylallyltransferase MiaA [Chloroflexota bacterium]
MAGNKLVVIVGPTAVGKTSFSLRVAQAFNGDIISADSRQVYKGLDIGTDKVAPHHRETIKHHLLDVVAPDEVLTLADFQEQAYKAIDSILQQQRLPLLVGGTGQWVWAVAEGWGIPRVAPDFDLRAKLEADAETHGHTHLHDQLVAVDPQAAAKLDSRNVRRVIRALEVYYKTGIPISQHQKKSPPPYNIQIIGLHRTRENLYQRIDDRIDGMIDEGLVAEVEQLVEAGYGWNLPAMSGLGYRQIGLYLQGEATLPEAIALIKKETRRFVRQQDNWFRRTDDRITWFAAENELEDAYACIEAFVREDS